MDIFILENIFISINRIKVNDDENQQSMSNELSMKIHKKSIRAVGFTPDGESILTVSKDKSIKLRSTETGKMIAKYKQAHEYFILVFPYLFFKFLLIYSSSINCLCVIDNCVLATGDDDGYVKVNRIKKAIFKYI